MRHPVLALSAILLAAATLAGQSRGSAADVEAALAAFWAADDARAAERAGEKLVAAGADFDLTWQRLKAGRRYAPQPTGARPWPTHVNGTLLDNIVEIPADYDPARRWPLRVELHGGVGRPEPRPGMTPARSLATTRIPGESQIHIRPRAWADLEWWRAVQVDNIANLVDAVKRTYNVDESRVYITGISDGGTGTLFFALRAATPWAACLSLNGHPVVLQNPDVGADQQLYATNVSNCPLYMVNGGRDPLYPADSVAPFVDLMRRAGASVEFHVHPEAVHNVDWWPEERPPYEKYLAAHPRVAHPERLTWETDRTDRYNRIRWLAIDRLGARPSDVALDDVNSVEWRGATRVVYDRERSSGRVDVVRTGNAFDARTRGVQEFTLLLSPDVVDFSHPIHVTVNGRAAFDGTVTKDVATLVKWAARDGDRTMLYGAELAVEVP
ncbi:MAG: dienelactone hydrolase family protein [Acidobacteria bacterium]|nr:dienelactone hydrolase family protein [Acidobacteriota bacterium]